jgi:DNA-binding beta-propeller fold protein YncE
MKRQGEKPKMTKWKLNLAALVALCLLHVGSAAGESKYEIWAIDQSNSPNLTYGGTLYIYDGKDMERGHQAAEAVPEKYDLAGAASTLCLLKTGVNPVRPHMIAMNASNTHAIISFVASGHVLIMDAATRTPVDCIRTSVGSTGARQVHLAIPSPDQTYIAVANQNGKLFERIDTNYATNTFVLNAAATIDLATCTTPNGVACQLAGVRPDNAPICPLVESTSRFSFVTLRGGGLFVVDAKSTPMKIVAEYDNSTVRPNGCLGIQLGTKMYVDSGGGTAAQLFGGHLYVFPVSGFSPLNPPNVPTPTIIFSTNDAESDAHGAALTNHGKHLWIADRGRNLIWVIDTSTDTVAGIIPLESPVSSDPTPDLLVTSPNGSHIFMSLRGPVPLTADPHVSTGSTPGVGVIKVLENGGNGFFEAVARVSNKDAGGIERADVHAMTIRLK